MNRKQKQVMDSLVRVRAFLDAYPVTGALSSASAEQSGRDMSRMELRRQTDQIALVLDGFIRPIVTIARWSGSTRSCVRRSAVT